MTGPSLERRPGSGDGGMCTSKLPFLVREALNWQREEERNLQNLQNKDRLPTYGSGDTYGKETESEKTQSDRYSLPVLTEVCGIALIHSFDRSLLNNYLAESQ